MSKNPKAVEAAAEFRAAADQWCAQLAAAIESTIPDGFNMNLQVTIRRGKVRVLPQPDYVSPGWTEKVG